MINNDDLLAACKRDISNLRQKSVLVPVELLKRYEELLIEENHRLRKALADQETVNEMLRGLRQLNLEQKED